jgi:arginyl-tRNA synthetase
VLAKELGNGFLQIRGKLLYPLTLSRDFLNLSVAESYWLQFLGANNKKDYGWQPSTGRKAMIEYSSPNTNKPLHLGHLRNNFLGWV